MTLRLLLATVMLLAAATEAAPLSAAPANPPGAGLHDISDPELNTLRGRYTIGSGNVAWFGVRMISTWQTAQGQLLQGSLAISMDFGGHGNQPRVSFQPSVSITRADAALPMPTVDGPGRHIDGSGLANVGGVLQSVQVAGDGNLADNVIHLDVRDGTVPASGSGDQVDGHVDARLDGARAAAGVDDHGASVALDVAGQGNVRQWIRDGSIGQSMQLASDNQVAGNLMEVELVRQSLTSNAQLTRNLSQNVAQAIVLARGIGNP